MQISNRLKNINGGGSDGWDLFYKARRMVADGVDIIQLNIGEHDIKTDTTILEAMHKAAVDGHTGYPAVPGIPELRETVARRVTKQSGVKTTADNVLITPGGQAGLYAAHTLTVAEGDVGLFCDPYYATYPSTIRGAGGVAVAVRTKSEEDFQPQRAALDRVAKRAKSLLINSPNNPSGVIYSQKTIDTICDFCKDEDLWLISDEVYDTQVWEGEHISPRSVEGMAERTLVIGSMSKSHAMTGSRVGWIVGPEEAIESLIDLATNTTYGVPGYIQDAALFALRAGPALEAKVAEPFRRRREMALNLIDKQNLVKAIPCSGAMYLMLDIRATGLSGEEFGDRLLEEHRIAVMPGESFGQAASGHLRVAMTTDDESFEKALSTLLDFANEVAA